MHLNAVGSVGSSIHQDLAEPRLSIALLEGNLPTLVGIVEANMSRFEFNRRFLFIALGTLKEAETQHLISDGLGCFKPNKADKLMTMSAEAGRLLTGLSKSPSTH